MANWDFGWEAAAPWAFTGGAGMVGRLMYLAREVKAGKKKPILWTLLWDIPIALGTGWIALGICIWLHLRWEPTVSVAIAIGYLGPYGIDLIFLTWAEQRFSAKKGTDNE